MNIAEFVLQPDLEKLVVVEVEIARKLQEKTWTQHGTYTNTWYISLPNDGEIVRVKEDGSAYTEKYAISSCNGTASTFYYDDLNKILYIHTSGSDDPATLSGDDPKYNIIAFWWEHFSNRPKQLEPYGDILKEANGSLEFWASATDVEEWTESVSGSSTITRGGTIVYNNLSAYSLKMTGDGSNNSVYFYKDIVLRPGRKVKIRLKYKMSTTGKTVYCALRDSGSNVYLNSNGLWQAASTTIPISNETDWTEFEIDFVTHASYTSYRLIFSRQDLTSASCYFDNIELLRYRQMVDCKPYLPQGAIPSVIQSVGDYYQPDEQLSFGSVSINNIDGWFYSRRYEEGYLWHGKTIRLRVGHIDEDYNDLAPFFTGVTRRPIWGSVVEIGVKDERILFQKIPLTRFNSTDYPNVEDAFVNKPVPIALGMVKDIPLPQSNTATKKFKISETSHGGTTYALVEVTNVYKNGSLLTLTTDYTVDLTNGEITLVCAWAEGDVITADVSGIDIDFWGDSNEVFYPANWLYFLYVVLNGVSKYRLNIASLVAMNAERKLGIGKWVLDEIDSLDFLIEIKKSAIIQTYVGLDGTIHFVYYTADVASDAPHYHNEDYIEEPREEEDTDQTFKEIVVKGQYRYNDGYYVHEKEAVSNQTEWNHREKMYLPFESLITLATQCQDLADNFSTMVKNPPGIIGTTLPSSALLLNPTDKIYLNHSKKDDDGNEVTIFDETVCRILSLEKDLNTGHVRVRAIRDVSDFFWTIT